MEKVHSSAEIVVSRVVEALGQQAALHVELLKAELARDSSALGRELAPLAIGLPLIVIAYVFGCVALTLAMVPWIGAAWGAAVVGLINLILGGGAVQLSLSSLKWRRRRADGASEVRDSDTSAASGGREWVEPAHVG